MCKTMSVSMEIPDKRQDSSTLFNASSLLEVGILPDSKREKTNAVFLYIFLGFIILSIPFLTYTLYYSDINRLKGYDKCGNICGQKNIIYEQWNCTGQDMTLKPVYSHYFTKECIDNREHAIGATITEKEIFDYIHRSMCKVALGCFVPLALCLILIIMFHYTPNVAVWSILFISWFVFTILGIAIVFSFIRWTVLPLAITCTISILLLFSWIFFNFNNIRLVSGLLQKATRPLFEIKKIICVSLGALTVSLHIVSIHATMCFHMLTAGRLQRVQDVEHLLVYIPDKIMEIGNVLNLVVAIWTIMTVLGIQNMTTSGAVAQWYTKKNQDKLGDVVPSSFRFTIIYHLGTIALGSVLMINMLMPRLFLQFLAAFSSMREKADAVLRYLDGFFTNNSYIITAIYATSFVQSGRKASKLLNVSIGNTRELNSFGNFVITTAQCFIIIISFLVTALAYGKRYFFFYDYSIFFASVACGIASLCCFTILETLKISYNTVFFCETEDLWRNQEANEPFTMTMKELVDGSNKLFTQKVQSKPPWYIKKETFCINLFVFIFVCVSIGLYLVSFFI